MYYSLKYVSDIEDTFIVIGGEIISSETYAEYEISIIKYNVLIKVQLLNPVKFMFPRIKLLCRLMKSIEINSATFIFNWSGFNTGMKCTIVGKIKLCIGYNLHAVHKSCLVSRDNFHAIYQNYELVVFTVLFTCISLKC